MLSENTQDKPGTKFWDQKVSLKRSIGFMLAFFLIGIGWGLLLYPSLAYPAIVHWGLIMAGVLLVILSAPLLDKGNR